MPGLFDSGGGTIGPIGGASGPAYSGGSPVFAIAAQDTASVLDGTFLGNKGAGLSTGMVLAVAGIALAMGALLTFIAKK